MSAVDSGAASGLAGRFRELCAAPGSPGTGDTVLVAVSGGMDSCALLHLLRFTRAGGPEGAPRLVAAHFDHRMRPGSDADARWLRGLCEAWSVPLIEGAAARPLRSEADARSARYAFLREAADRAGASAIATAHHADDQAETVLFRMLRGTGPAGLRGIRGDRDDGVWRPLRSVWRKEIVAYARSARLSWREDPTNESLAFARNALRHRVLPDAERLVAPGSRRALVRFAELAAHDEEGWESLIPALMASVAPVRGPGTLSVDRASLRAMHPAVRARVLRALALESGLRLGARATSLAVAFATTADSGRALDLGRGLVLRRDLDRLVLTRSGDVPQGPGASRAAGSEADDREEHHRHPGLVIESPGEGSGRVRVGGRDLWVGWGARPAARADFMERFVAATLRFPLVVRAWEHGDRMRTAGGRRRLKKIFLEARVPAPERRCLPVVADALGDVLWVPGVARARGAPTEPPSPNVDTWAIGIE